jgi:hypothetical protein
MAVTVTNVSDMLLLVRLRSGSTLRLPPGRRTGELADGEVLDNPRVDTLKERRLVRIDAAPAGSAETAEAATAEPAEAAGAAGSAEATEPSKPQRGRSGSKASEGSAG